MESVERCVWTTGLYATLCSEGRSTRGVNRGVTKAPSLMHDTLAGSQMALAGAYLFNSSFYPFVVAEDTSYGFNMR